MTSLHNTPLFGQYACEPLLDRLQTPIWIFDIEQERMHYANAAALRLWDAATIEELGSRDWSGSMSKPTRQRLADYHRRLTREERIDEQWTFYPGDRAVSVHCRCSGIILEEGRIAMLVEGLENETPLDAHSLRALEALRHTPLIVSVFDDEGQLLVRNPAALEARLGITSFDASFMDQEFAKQILQQLESQPRCSLDALMRINEGERWHHVDICRATDPKTAQPMIVMGEFDITPRKRLEKAQLLSKRQLEVVIEGLDVGLLLEDESRAAIMANQVFCRLFGIEAAPEALVGMDCQEVAQASKILFTEPECFIERIEELILRQHKQARDILAMTDGRFMERSYTPVFAGDQYRGHLWAYRDITKQVRKEADWAHKASTDALTGLANRRAFNKNAQRVAGAVREGALQAALLMIDIDHFKAINDTLGHAEGDKGLRLLSDTLRDNLRDGDLPCRIGGEEFTVIMPSMSPEGAESVANRLLEAIAERSRHAEDLPFSFTVSIGVTAFAAADASLEAVTRRADVAMYRAKHEGRNRVVVLLPHSYEGVP